jgi:SRSO17 transposase
MNRDALRASAGKLQGFQGRFGKCFGRVETRQHAAKYVEGLLAAEGRKNVERMVLQESAGSGTVDQAEVLSRQHFLTASPWESSEVQREIQAVFAESLVPTTKDWSLGTVLVIDESSFIKQGEHSVGVKQQYCGRLGTVANCQVGVFLVGVTPGGDCLLDHQLYLPAEWARDRARRRKARVPAEVKFRTKPQLAAELVERLLQNKLVKPDWIVADEGYGDCGHLLDTLETHGLRYVVESAITKAFWTANPLTQIRPRQPGRGRPPSRARRDSVRSAKEIAAVLPAGTWRPLKLREGAKGPVVYEYARVRIWAKRHKEAGPPIWLMFQREIDRPQIVRCWVSNAEEAVSLETLAEVASQRIRVEQFFEEAKGEVGMADYEARAWTSWHHHMSLVALAHLFIITLRLELRCEEPQLTLRQSFELLQAALARPRLSLDEAMQLLDYHVHRNQTATQSHRKSWLQKHQRLREELML